VSCTVAQQVMQAINNCSHKSSNTYSLQRNSTTQEMTALNLHQETCLETIQAMRRQEESGYACSDYLWEMSTMTDNDQLLSEPVDAQCRHAMATWSYQIVDYCNFKRETAASSMSILDRFCASPEGQHVLLDRDEFQLAAMTALYTAVKVHEQEAMNPQLISNLSRGAHTKEAVENMEFRMLNAIQWRVNPPTAMAFMKHFLDLVPPHILEDQARTTVTDLAQYQVELAVCDYNLGTQKASSMAFASLMNAIESLDDGHLLSNFEGVIVRASEIDSRSHQFSDIRIRLYESIAEQEPGTEQMGTKLAQRSTIASSICNNSDSSSIYSSPRSVA
jgi:hypothetical protein